MGSGLSFGNPIVGGDTLVRARIKSPNYAPGIDGWTINRDGSAEFNNVIVRGELDIGDSADNRDIKIGNDIPPEIQDFTDDWYGTFHTDACIVYYLGSVTHYYFQGVGTLNPDGTPGNLYPVYMAGYTAQFTPSDPITIVLTDIITLNSQFGIETVMVDTWQAFYGGAYDENGWLETKSTNFETRFVNQDALAANTTTALVSQTRYATFTNDVPKQVIDTSSPTWTPYGTLGGMFAGVTAAQSPFTMATGTSVQTLLLPDGSAMGFYSYPAWERIYKVEAFFVVTATTTDTEVIIELHYDTSANLSASSPVVAASQNVHIDTAFAKPVQWTGAFYIENEPTEQMGFLFTCRRTHGTGSWTCQSYRNYPSWAAISDFGQVYSAGPWLVSPESGSGW